MGEMHKHVPKHLQRGTAVIAVSVIHQTMPSLWEEVCGLWKDQSPQRGMQEQKYSSP